MQWRYSWMISSLRFHCLSPFERKAWLRDIGNKSHIKLDSRSNPHKTSHSVKSYKWASCSTPKPAFKLDKEPRSNTTLKWGLMKCRKYGRELTSILLPTKILTWSGTMMIFRWSWISILSTLSLCSSLLSKSRSKKEFWIGTTSSKSCLMYFSNGPSAKANGCIYSLFSTQLTLPNNWFNSTKSSRL